MTGKEFRDAIGHCTKVPDIDNGGFKVEFDDY